MKIMKMAAAAMMSAVAFAGVSAVVQAGEFDGVTINILTRLRGNLPEDPE